MPYAPGSFSKNFAWHGEGLRKLHTTIRNGFHNTLLPIDRQSFRANSGVESGIVLIPINFFLHNSGGCLSVDELVFQAIKRDHTLQFDRLSLFALNLNRVGGGDTRGEQDIVSRPAMWANEFVREILWSSGAWQTRALRDDRVDLFLAERLNAQKEVRVKCRSNYRHLFELCKYWPNALSMINTGSDQWIASALFLAWDRHILDGGEKDEASLLSLIDTDELYKLLGVTRDYTLAQAMRLLDLYGTIGHVDRFGQHAKDEVVPLDVAGLSEDSPEIPKEMGLDWLEQGKLDGVVERQLVERNEQKRSRKNAVALKQHYDNTCQFCGTRLQVADEHFYSEAAHIKGLGEPHGGTDTPINMLVLCPNHHLQFDQGFLRLLKVGTDYQIWSKATSDPLHGKMIKLAHSLDDACVKHHYRWFDRRMVTTRGQRTE